MRPHKTVGTKRLILAWAGLVLLGTVLLRLPWSSSRERLTWLDALFTSTSGVCVTGLSTIDVGTDLSTAGQAVLLVLMQVGGLGISVLSTLLLVAAGKATLSHQLAVQDSLAAVRMRPLRLLRWAVPVALIVETAGAGLLAQRLGGGAGAWWQGTFHSVSAFCNAGFCLYPDSLARLRTDGVAMGAVMALIALGGLGFITLHQLFCFLVAVVRRQQFRLFLHTRAVLLASGALWLIGAAIFAVLEWEHAMSGLDAGGKFLSSLFQSVTTRTAGFSTVDFGALRTSTLLLAMFLMLIGGAPGSCAGGVKVTTVVVILAAVRARLRGTPTVHLMKRTVPPETASRAYHIVTLAVVFLAMVVVGLLITEEGRKVTGACSDRFAALLFEAGSALGTVGLSTGATAGLSAGGKLLIIVTMFVGRLGPLAVALSLFGTGTTPAFEYPREELAIG